MKILVLNCGSSSIKYKLFDMTTKEILAQGGIEKIGLVGSFLKLTLPNGEKKILEKDIPEHTAGIEFILNTLVSPEYGAIKSLEEINAVGHRMVHGASRSFTSPQPMATKGTTLVVWAVKGVPSGFFIFSALPWSAVRKAQPPVPYRPSPMM